ncbi:frizzled-7-like [Dendronephthya gigantea]|uniref:frizzled-7-like n=1 Tax=Dendronephthya gigantea TaxID=151771 RepID=UPI001069A046|nr:frizzled-7-like [Dendronephthya gigantea]
MGLQSKCVIIALIFVVVSSVTLAKRRCEKIKIPFCKGLGYNTTIFPNNLDQDTQDEAKQSASEFTSLVKIQCSPEIALFLCALYAPVCTQMHKPLPPCRSLCQNARVGCEGLMNDYGFKWPDRFKCSNFPEHGLCIGRNASSSSHETQKLKPGKKVSVHKIRKKKCAKESHDGKLCCKLGRRAAKKGYYCNLRKKDDNESRKTIRFRKLVIRKCSLHSSCFRSCCEVSLRKRRSNKRNAKRKIKNRE